MKKHPFAALMALSVIIYSCKKENDRSMQDKLIGKWSMTSAKWNNNYNNANHYDSSAYATGLFTVEFKSNGTVIASTSYTTKDTANFKLIDGDKKIVFDGTDTLTIDAVTDTDLQLYSKEVYSSTSFYEEWDNYKKQ